MRLHIVDLTLGNSAEMMYSKLLFSIRIVSMNGVGRTGLWESIVPGYAGLYGRAALSNLWRVQKPYAVDSIIALLSIRSTFLGYVRSTLETIEYVRILAQPD